MTSSVEPATNNPETAPRNNYLIESIDNGSRILLMLRDRPVIRAADVARELGVARSTAHRMVTTLQHRGLLRQNQLDKTFSAGYALVELGMSVIGASDIRSESEPYLERLASQAQETAHLLFLEGTEVVFVAGVESDRVVRAALRVGARFPAHITAAGRCLLATLSDERIKELYPSTRLKGGTEHAVHTRKELLEDLRQVRHEVCTLNESQSESDLTAIAMPLVDSHGLAHGAMVVSGPSGRMKENMDKIRESLIETVEEFKRTVLS